MAFRIFLAHIQTGRDMVFTLANDETKGRLEIGYAFKLAAKFDQVSRNLGLKGQ